MQIKKTGTQILVKCVRLVGQMFYPIKLTSVSLTVALNSSIYLVQILLYIQIEMTLSANIILKIRVFTLQNI